VNSLVTRRIRPSHREEAREIFRSAVLDAAETIFAKRGFHQARIQDIATLARVGVGTVYNHFEQKEDILRALLRERMQGLLDAVTPLPGDPNEFQGKLRACLARLVAYISSHRDFFTLANDNGLLGPAASSADTVLQRRDQSLRFRRALQALIQEGIDQGALPDGDPLRLTRYLGGLLKAAVHGALEDGRADFAPEADAVATFFLRGTSHRA
jgi:AcrR family transcriptional regulator